jgi:hypothetical protein
MSSERMKTAFLSIACVLATVFFTCQAEAVRIRVSQESSPGAGNFDAHVLGVIESFDDSGKTAVQSYAYSTTSSGGGYQGTAITPQADTSHVFFVNTSSGLALFIVHDKNGDNDLGRAEMRVELSGDPSGAAFLVKDDPDASEPTGGYTVSGGTLFSSRQEWDPNNNYVTISVTAVTQDEPVDGLGDGDTSPDAVLQGHQVLLRAERAGNGNGRVCHVTFTADDDGIDGHCTGTVTVCIPGKAGSCVDDGPLYDSAQSYGLRAGHDASLVWSGWGCS